MKSIGFNVSGKVESVCNFFNFYKGKGLTVLQVLELLADKKEIQTNKNICDLLEVKI